MSGEICSRGAFFRGRRGSEYRAARTNSDGIVCRLSTGRHDFFLFLSRDLFPADDAGRCLDDKRDATLHFPSPTPAEPIYRRSMILLDEVCGGHAMLV